MDQIVAKARALLQSSQIEKALEILQPAVKQHPENVPLLEVLADTMLELNDVESAYNILMKAVELDPEAKQGVEKFLNLGQIIGGRDGCQLLDIAIARCMELLDKVALEPEFVSTSGFDSAEEFRANFVKKFNLAIFAEIEIWMTDLCMEPEAEQMCDQLISQSLKLDDSNPEAHSLLALIRISQQRHDDAVQAVQRSWNLFSEKKTLLETQQNREGEEASFEYLELVQPLLSLARHAVELEEVGLVPEISAAVGDINNNCLDIYYYEALAALLAAKKEAGLKTQDIANLPVSELINKSPEIDALLEDARSALTQAYRVLNSVDLEDLDPELVEQVNSLLGELGGPNMAELVEKRRYSDDDSDSDIEIE